MAATSALILKYGTYEFSPTPQIGSRISVARVGASQTGPGTIERIVTVRGILEAENGTSIQDLHDAMLAAMAKDRQTLYWARRDGSKIWINQTAHVQDFDLNLDWNEYQAQYTITFRYLPLNETHNAPFSASYNGYTFDPIPAMGREFSAVRDSEAGPRRSTSVRLTLDGFIAEGSHANNVAELNALAAALSEDDVLTYGSLITNVRVERFSHPPDILDRRVPYAVVFAYETDIGGDGVKKLQSTRRISRVTQRSAWGFSPFIDGSLAQTLGETDQQITAVGFVIAETMAEARAACVAELDTMIPPNGIEIEGSSITEDPNEIKVEWNVTHRYTSPVLRGGAYGAS